MAIEAKTKSIGASDYTVEPHGAIKGRALLLRLVKVVGPSLTAVSQDSIPDAIRSLLDGLTEEDLTFLCNEFAAKTMVTVDGGELQLSKIFDAHFIGSYVEMIQWLAWAIEVNFGSFFRGAGALLSKGVASAVAKAESKSESPKA